MATEFNDTIKAGYTYSFVVLDQEKTTGTPTDLTGATAILELKREADTSETPALQLTSSPAAGLVIDPLLGKTTVTMTAAQTALLTGTYQYHLANYFTGGVRVQVLEGRFTIEPQLIA